MHATLLYCGGNYICKQKIKTEQPRGKRKLSFQCLISQAHLKTLKRNDRKTGASNDSSEMAMICIQLMADEHNCVSRLDFSGGEGRAPVLPGGSGATCTKAERATTQSDAFQYWRCTETCYQLTSACDQWCKESPTQKGDLGSAFQRLCKSA